MTREEIVIEVMQLAQKALREQAAAQGHTLTGRLSESIQFQTSSNGSETVGQMYFEDYGTYVDVGVTADRIPYGKGGGRGGTSKYIQGLIEFWEHRGLSGREAIGAAFATAKVHAREGMPSRGSYAFTTTGERTGFVSAALNESKDEIRAIIEKESGIMFEIEISSALKGGGNKIRFES